MKIHLLKNGFDVQQEERIHEASRTILELCTETVAMFGRVVWLVYVSPMPLKPPVADDPLRVTT